MRSFSRTSLTLRTAGVALLLAVIGLSLTLTFKNMNLSQKVGAVAAAEDIPKFISPQVLIDTQALKETFTTATQGKYPLEPTYFGSYVVYPLDNTLYVGLSAGLPAEHNGAALAVYQNASLSAILNADGSNSFSEQGMHRIVYDGTQFIIPGTDPVEPVNEWSLGNVYTYIPGQDVIKHRTLENTMHSLGALVEGNTIYVGTGSHIGDNQTWEGRLYKSTDNGDNWTYTRFSSYRLWDVIRYKGDLYGLGFEDSSVPVFKKSTDNGQTWQDSFAGDKYDAYPRTKTIEYNGMLVNRENSTSTDLWVFDGTSERWVTLPGGYYTFGNYALNALTTDGRGYLYVIARRSENEGGSLYGNNITNIILRTNDLVHWELVTELTAQPFMLSYWPAHDQLVVGTNGDNAKLWSIQLSDSLSLPPIIPIPTLTPSPIPPTATPTWFPPAPITPVVSQEGKLLYAGFGEVYIANADGSNKQTVIKNGETGSYYQSGVSWSVDGKYIAIVARKYNSSDYNYTYQLLTKSYPEGVYEEWLPPQAKNISFTHPHLSPNNNEMYFSMNAGVDDYYGIYKVRRGEKQVMPIIPAPSRGKYLLGDISPDGSQMVYYFGGDGSNPQSDDIFVANVDGTNTMNLSNTPGRQELYPTFSSDGKRVMFYEFNSANSTYDLSEITIATKQKKMITASLDIDESYGCYSPDGTSIAYGGRTVITPYVDSIYRSKSDGTERKTIISPSSNAWLQMHCWAPDPLYVSPTETPTPTRTVSPSKTLTPTKTPTKSPTPTRARTPLKSGTPTLIQKFVVTPVPTSRLN